MRIRTRSNVSIHFKWVSSRMSSRLDYLIFEKELFYWRFCWLSWQMLQMSFCRKLKLNGPRITGVFVLHQNLNISELIRNSLFASDELVLKTSPNGKIVKRRIYLVWSSFATFHQFFMTSNRPQTAGKNEREYWVTRVHVSCSTPTNKLILENWKALSHQNRRSVLSQ